MRRQGLGRAELTAGRPEPATVLNERSRRLRRLSRAASREKLGIVGGLILLAVVVAAVFAPQLAPCDPSAQSLRNRLRPPATRVETGPMNYLGTDYLGRDCLSRILYGSRISLFVATISVAGSCLVGVLLGLVGGYFGGRLESFLMRLTDLQLALPLILVALAILGVLGASLRNITLVFVVTSWPVYTRVVHGMVLSLKQRDFVIASQALGASHIRIMVRHLLPNVVANVIVIASFEMARLVILESALGFLGLGVPPPTPTWGNMLAEGRQYIQDAWWLMTFPGLALSLTAASINFLGDGLRSYLDPTSMYT